MHGTGGFVTRPLQSQNDMLTYDADLKPRRDGGCDLVSITRSSR